MAIRGDIKDILELAERGARVVLVIISVLAFGMAAYWGIIFIGR